MNIEPLELDLLNLLKLSQQEINLLYKQIPAEDLQKNSGKWTVEQHLKHICTSEKGLFWIINDVSKGGKGASEAFDLDRYNNASQQKLSSVPLLSLISEFNTNREQLILFTKNLSKEQFELRGRHASGNIYSIDQLIFIAAVHPLHHLQAICEILGTKFEYATIHEKFLALF